MQKELPMQPYVKTRWTENGQVETTLDVSTAHELLDVLAQTYDKGTVDDGLTVLHDSLSHTLNVERKP
jgi:hypothetical protein